MGSYVMIIVLQKTSVATFKPNCFHNRMVVPFLRLCVSSFESIKAPNLLFLGTYVLFK